MASDIFLKLDSIVGESNDIKHKGEIEIDSFSWGVSQSGTFSAGGGGGAGKAQFQDFHFTTGASKASPSMFKACASGQHIKNAVLTVRKAGEQPLEYYHIKMSDVLVSSYQSSGSGGGGVPTESLSLNFAKIEFSFTEQSADGKPGATFSAGWDLKANKAV